MEGVDEDLILCATLSLRESDYDMMIPWMGGLRSKEEQFEIFLQGNSKLDGKNKVSKHQKGEALDIIPVEGKYKNDKAFNHFAQIMFGTWQRLLKEDKVNGVLEWGGFWGWDKPHWQKIEE